MSDDLIRRSDVYKAVDDWLEGRVSNLNIKDIPFVDIPQSDDWERYSDKLWKLAYEKGKEDEKRWWSGFCAKCTDEDSPQGEWIDCKGGWKCTSCNKWSDGQYTFCPHCGARMKGADDE